MQPLDVVILKTDLPGVRMGSLGTIVDHRTDQPTILVEFDEGVEAVERTDIEVHTPWVTGGMSKTVVGRIAVS